MALRACARSRCVRKFDAERYEEYYVKDLKKLKRRGYRLEHVIVVHDTPRKLLRNRGNVVRVHPYLGETVDNELLLLEKYLEKLKEVENVRSIEKRGWRNDA